VLVAERCANSCSGWGCRPTAVCSTTSPPARTHSAWDATPPSCRSRPCRLFIVVSSSPLPSRRRYSGAGPLASNPNPAAPGLKQNSLDRARTGLCPDPARALPWTHQGHRPLEPILSSAAQPRKYWGSRGPRPRFRVNNQRNLCLAGSGLTSAIRPPAESTPGAHCIVSTPGSDHPKCALPCQSAAAPRSPPRVRKPAVPPPAPPPCRRPDR